MGPIKILLIDDDKVINFLHRLKLEEVIVDCVVDEVLGGQAALDYLTTHEECPDVILLDLNMPGMDGFEFLEEYEKLGKCVDKSKKFLFIVTSSQRDEDKIKVTANRLVKGYFEKPLIVNNKEILACF
jgi:CheY-like chemotaxis protein